MYRINGKNLYKVHFGFQTKKNEKPTFFENPFFGTAPPGEDQEYLSPLKRKSNLEPLTRRVFGKKKKINNIVMML